jgi:hypothetical protein
VELHGGLGGEQLAADRAVGQPVRELPQHVQLTRGEPLVVSSLQPSWIRLWIVIRSEIPNDLAPTVKAGQGERRCCAPGGIRTPNLLIRRSKFTLAEQHYLGIRCYECTRRCSVGTAEPPFMGQRLDTTCAGRRGAPHRGRGRPRSELVVDMFASVRRKRPYALRGCRFAPLNALPAPIAHPRALRALRDLGNAIRHARTHASDRGAQIDCIDWRVTHSTMRSSTAGSFVAEMEPQIRELLAVCRR